VRYVQCPLGGGIAYVAHYSLSLLSLLTSSGHETPVKYVKVNKPLKRSCHDYNTRLKNSRNLAADTLYHILADKIMLCDRKTFQMFLLCWNWCFCSGYKRVPLHSPTVWLITTDDKKLSYRKQDALTIIHILSHWRHQLWGTCACTSIWQFLFTHNSSGLL